MYLILLKDEIKAVFRSLNSSLHFRALNFCYLVWSKVGLDTLNEADSIM